MDENCAETIDWLGYWQQRLSERDRVYAMPVHTWGGQLCDARSEKSPSFPCVFPFSSLAIHADGSVGQCNVDYNSINCLGNAGTHSLKEIWNGAALTALRNAHVSGSRRLYPLCKTCSVWERNYLE
jgi:radical SAM protein with 4Fe4S-binding SPASM domain